MQSPISPLEERPPSGPILNIPAAVSWTFGILALLHVARVFLPQDLQVKVLLTFAFIPARLHGLEAVEPDAFLLTGPAAQAITFLSHALLHGDAVHLLLNGIWLVIFGAAVTRRIGTGRFLLLLALATIAGALTHLAFYWDSQVPVVGASGGISGLMAAGIRIIFARRRFRLLPDQVLETHPLAPLNHRGVVAFTTMWIIVNLLIGIMGAQAFGSQGMVAWEAHIGGYLAGLFLIGWINPGRVQRFDFG